MKVVLRNLDIAFIERGWLFRSVIIAKNIFLVKRKENDNAGHCQDNEIEKGYSFA